MDAAKWATRAAINAILGGLLGVGIPAAINGASTLFGGTGTIVPTGGFAEVFLAVIVFLAMLFIELALDFRAEATRLRQELPKIVGDALKLDLEDTIGRSFASAMTRTLSSDPEAARAIASFLSQYFAALERVPRARRTVAAVVAELRGVKFIESIDQSLSEGFEVSSAEGLQIAQALVPQAKSYICIDQGIYDWRTYWTPAWHEFANRLRAHRSLHKQWICLLPRATFEREWTRLGALRTYVLKHGFEYRFVDKERVEQAMARKIDQVLGFETIELIGNMAIIWNTSGQGYRGKTPHVRVLDLESAVEIGRAMGFARTLSDVVDDAEAARLQRNATQAVP